MKQFETLSSVLFHCPVLSRLTKNGAYDTVHRVNQAYKDTEDPNSTSTTVKVRESSHEYD